MAGRPRKSTKMIHNQVRAYFIHRYNNDYIRAEKIYLEIADKFGYAPGTSKNIVSVKDALNARREGFKTESQRVKI